MDLVLSQHATKRCSQRGIKKEDIEFALKYGTKIYSSGALFVFVRKKDLPSKMQGKCEGLTLVITPEGKVLKTTYKDRRAIKKIKRKQW